MLRSRVGAIVVLVALTAGLTACAGSTVDAPSRITVSVEHCGDGWRSPHAGQQTFDIRNTDIVAGEVYLVNPRSGAVYAYVENVAPGAAAILSVRLGSGRFQFRCAMSDRNVARGKTVVVAGRVKGTTAVAAVTEQDLLPATKAYHSYVEDSLPDLATLVGVLGADLDAGRLDAARIDWLPAHLAYERLGAAYGAFGDADVAINGTSNGLPDGVADDAFTGFHRIEYGLFHAQTAAQLAPYGHGLVVAVQNLAISFATERIAPLDLSIRAHEIVENALQFDLTGQSDYGSGTELASVDAELAGTNEILGLLQPVVESRYPAFGETRAALRRAQSDLRAEMDASGWNSVDALPRPNRERIDADISQLAGLLAPVASICEPRIVS